MFGDKTTRRERMQDIRMTASEKALVVLLIGAFAIFILRIGMSL